MSANQARFRIATMARVLGVSPSGYYAWRRRGPSARAQADADLTVRVSAIHARSRGTYGAPRIQAELSGRRGRGEPQTGGAGDACGGHCGGEPAPRAAHDAAGGCGSGRPRIRVARRFEAAGPNRLWVADITYVPTLAGFLYLAVVLDVFSRRVVGQAMAAHLRTALVTGALEMAVKQRRPAAVIHHSDQGCQYTSPAFGARCQEWGVTPSMGSVGDCFDNAMAESFFATLECELLDRTKWATHAEARSAVFAFIEGWYNTRRRHSALGYLSPLDFERLRETAPADGDRPGEALEPAVRVAARRAGAGWRRHRRCCRKHGEGMMAHGSPRCREADNRRDAASADRAGAGGAVDLPGLWTPAGRRTASADRRGGRPQAVGNLAGDRCRRCLHRGREIPTGPQRLFLVDDSHANPSIRGTCHDGNPSVNLSTESGQPHRAGCPAGSGGRGVGAWTWRAGSVFRRVWWRWGSIPASRTARWAAARGVRFARTRRARGSWPPAFWMRRT